MTTLLLTSLKQKISEFTLIPSTGGCFEIRVNGDILYSKLQSGDKFPEEQWVLDSLKARTASG